MYSRFWKSCSECLVSLNSLSRFQCDVFWRSTQMSVSKRKHKRRHDHVQKVVSDCALTSLAVANFSAMTLLFMMPLKRPVYSTYNVMDLSHRGRTRQALLAGDQLVGIKKHELGLPRWYKLLPLPNCNRPCQYASQCQSLHSVYSQIIILSDILRNFYLRQLQSRNRRNKPAEIN